MWDMPHSWELILTEWYKRFVLVCSLFSSGHIFFFFYNRPLINITLLALSVLDQRAIKETSEAAPLPGC